MATQYTVVYTYNRGDGKFHRYEKTIPIGDFTVTGDTDKKITKVISVEATTRLKNYGSDTEHLNWQLGLEFSNTSSRVLTELQPSKRTSPKNWATFKCSVSSANINAINANKWQNLQSFVSIQYTGWYKFESYPLIITVVFESEEYFPRISDFAGSRCDQDGTLDDEGESFAYSFHIGVENTTTLTDAPTYIRLVCGDIVLHTFYDTRTGSSMLNINSWINNPSVKTGRVDSIGGDEFSIGNNYLIRLEFCYHGELVQPLEVLLPKAKVNVHESGMKNTNGDPIGGIAFGQYSSVTTTPKFECNYPAYFYQNVSFEGGITGIPKIAYGQTDSITVAAGQYSNPAVTVSYSSAGFTSAPLVICSFLSASTDGEFGRCCVSSCNVTTTQCEVRVFNGDNSQRAPRVVWIAIGN